MKSRILLLWISSMMVYAGPNDVISDGLGLSISQKSIDTIIHYEVGGRDYYNRYLTKPTVPAWRTTSSGVTVGFGIDLGYNTKSQIRETFSGIISESEIQLLQSVAGLKGRDAYYNGLPKVKYNMSLTYDEAECIFKNNTLPNFTNQTARAFKISKNQLHPHSNGALTSLVFNRGPSMSSRSSRREMRWIKYNISIGRLDRVPSDIKSMKRLWSYSKLKGLHLRRDAEAKLFQEGLNSQK